MKVKFLVEEDFVNYKKPSMFIGFPTCTWKCEKECGKKMCQNSSLAHSPDIEIEYEEIVKRYLDNPISKAVVFGGLEPFDSLSNLNHLVKEFRKHTDDDIVIYTGYTEDELLQYPYQISYLESIRFRFIRVIFFHGLIIL